MNASTLPRYFEFGVQSNFSFLRAASKPEELVVAACLMGHAGMGLADRNTLAGVVRGWSQAKSIQLPDRAAPVALPYHPGARLVFADDTPDILAYPQDREGWGHLCRLLTEANMREESPKGAPLLYRDDVLKWGDRISLAVRADCILADDREIRFIQELKERFSGSVWIAIAPVFDGQDKLRLAQAMAMSKATGASLMAVNDVLYHGPERRHLQDVLTSIRINRPVRDAGFELSRNAERHLKPPLEMARLFRSCPSAILETVRFAETLKFSLSELKHNYPDEKTRGGATAQEELERLTWEGAAYRWPDGIAPRDRQTIEKELALVAKLNYAGYFLTVHDIVRHAREVLGILCQGRGSAANSLICYCLRITDIGPDRMDVLFERFISEERGEPPDIDVDFEHERRPEILEYIYQKYSQKHTSLAAAVISYRSRSAMREVGKAMGLSDDTIDALASNTWRWTHDNLGATEARAAGLDMSEALTRKLFENVNEILEFPRHLSQHVGGFVITKDRLDEIVPIMKTAMPDRKMIEWDKDDLDTVGLFKVDILALGMLSCLRRCFDLLEQHYDERDLHGRPVTLATLPKEKSDVYDMICRADTLGVFQIESRAQMSMLPRLKPRKFYDLVIEVAIVRPGPIQGDMVHPYLKRREGQEQPHYVKPELRSILERTLGVPLFQEQAMKIAIVAARFPPAKADKLRRAMATFRRTGMIGKMRDEFIQGMVANDYPKDFAERCFRQIEGFGEYGFPESHAASFALLVYASCWFKTYYPDVFCAAILNSQPMGFYAPAQLIRDAQDHGIEILPVDVNRSVWDSTLTSAPFDPSGITPRHAPMRDVIRSRHAVQLGLRHVKGLSEKAMETFVECRGAGYTSVRDVWLRSGLHRRDIELLAQADAFRSIGLDRRAALWDVRALDARSAAESLPIFDRPDAPMLDLEPKTTLPAMPLGQHVVHDYRSMGFSLKAHPLAFFRERLNGLGITPNVSLPDIKNGRYVSVAGLILVRQRPGSAKGVIFMTLEDEISVANIVVWQKMFERFRPVVLGSRFVRVDGKLQSASGVIHVVADRIVDLTPWLSDLSEHAMSIDAYARADEVKHGGHDPRTKRPPRNAVLEAAASKMERGHEARDVMPKGRNFH
ncbi:MAG: error-prone DNA polymerase [Rhizobiaceae bacterium]|nr:error-prone DNA polymerase [Rhizobiaceae bacterium]